MECQVAVVTVREESDRVALVVMVQEGLVRAELAELVMAREVRDRQALVEVREVTAQEGLHREGLEVKEQEQEGTVLEGITPEALRVLVL